MTSALNLLLTGHSMLEELLDLVAVGGWAGLVVTSGGMHQQSHGALQLLLPLSSLRVCQPHLQLIDAPHLGLQRKGHVTYYVQ